MGKLVNFKRPDIASTVSSVIPKFACQCRIWYLLLWGEMHDEAQSGIVQLNAFFLRKRDDEEKCKHIYIYVLDTTVLHK